MQFGTWLRDARTRERQSGVDHHRMACYAASLTPYVQDRMSRALQGMEELYAQLPSAILPEDEQRRQWEESRAEFVERMREAVGFIGATLTAIGCTESELAHPNVPEVDPEDPDYSSDGDDESDNEKTALLDVTALQQETDDGIDGGDDENDN